MRKIYCLFLLVFCISFHLYLLSQLSFTVWPEMLLMPYVMRRGFELYRDMIVPWTPGLIWILAGWFRLFGLSPERLKLLTWVLVAIIDVLVFSIAKKRRGDKAGLAALLFFIALQPVFDGNGVWFDLMAAPFLLLAFDRSNPFFLWVAFFVKQSSMWLFVLLIRQLKMFFLGMVVVLGGSSVWFWLRGTLLEYWSWAYDYTFRVFPTMSGHADFGNWRNWIFALTPFLLVGLLKLLHERRRFITKLSVSDPFLWTVFALPFALPRFGLFHFQPAIAFLSLEVGSLIQKINFRKSNFPTFALCLLLIVYCLFSWLRLYRSQWHKQDRFLESEIFQYSAKIALETNSEQSVLLVNGPELSYVLADRLPPKPWFTQFPWFLELPGFQKRAIEQFKQQNLQQVFFTPYLLEGAFVPGTYRPSELLEYLGYDQ